MNITPAKTIVETVVNEMVATILDEREKNPSDWNITAADDGVICVNSVTGRTFEGTIVAFCKMLKD